MGACLQLFMFLIDGDALRLASIWLYLIGPTLGAYLAHYFYTMIYLALKWTIIIINLYLELNDYYS